MLTILPPMPRTQLRSREMNSKTKEEVGTIVLLHSNTKASYRQSNVVTLSRAMQPVVNKFEGYLGRKVAFSQEDSSLLVDLAYYRDERTAMSAAEKELKSETCDRYFKSLDMETLRQFTFSPVLMNRANKGEAKAIELVLFRTKPEFTITDIETAGASMDPIMKQMKGYISRKLAVTVDGLWMDLVHWSDLESAAKASKYILEKQLGQSYFEMIDESTLDFAHLNVVIDSERYAR